MFMGSTGRLVQIGLLALTLSNCYKPPYNNFKPYPSSMNYYQSAPSGLAIGAVAMGAVGGPIFLGTAAGAVIGTGVAHFNSSKKSIIKELQKYQIQFVQYGDTTTLIVPTDRYFYFNSARLNQFCYQGLVNILRLISLYPPCPVYVAGFTNDVGSRYHKRMLTQAQAEAMVTFLWANGIPARRLNPEGYSDKHPVSDNKLIHGSAQNRRLEIQFFSNCSVAVPPRPLATYIK